jgi:hypothetical protein
MYRHQKRRRPATAETASLDPIALSIAIWLGLAVTVAALARATQSDDAPRPAETPAMITVY